MRFRALAAALLFSGCCIPLTWAQCEPTSSKYYVANVNLENAGHLSPEQQARVKLMIVGKCFDDSLSGLSSPIFDLYQTFGYFQATVYEPHNFRVLDEARHPEPVSLTFDVEERSQFLVEGVEWWGVEASSINDQDGYPFDSPYPYTLWFV